MDGCVLFVTQRGLHALKSRAIKRRKRYLVAKLLLFNFCNSCMWNNGLICYAYVDLGREAICFFFKEIKSKKICH